jgi:hypothetical protein
MSHAMDAERVLYVGYRTSRCSRADAEFAAFEQSRDRGDRYLLENPRQLRWRRKCLLRSMRKQSPHLVLSFCVLLAAATTCFAVADRADSTKPDTNGTAKTARDLLAHALQDARKRLQQRECAALFGPAAQQTLSSAEYKLMSLGPPRLVGNEILVTAARTVLEENIVMINLDGPFVTPRLYYGGRHYRLNGILTGSASPTVLSDAEFRVVILLHELGHLLGSFAPDTNDLKRNQANNRAVLSHCFRIEAET